MLRYTIRSFGGILSVIFLLSLFTFVMARAIPGGPWDVSGNKGTLTEHQIDVFKAKYGLDKPVLEQYLIWLRNAVTLDFGSPYMAPEMSVTALILKQLPYSALVGGLAAAMAVFFGILLGMLAAAKQNTWIDVTINSFAVVIGTIPGFVLGFVLAYFLGSKLHWFPTGGWQNEPKYVVLPVIAFGFPAIGGVARWTRQCIVEAMSSDYVRTAYSKGVRQTGVIVRHVLRNAAIPMITSFLPMFPAMMTGSVFIERTFGIPGLGQYFVQSSMSRDYPLVTGITIFWALLISVTYLITDILYGVIDPRVRLEGKKR
jgi:ABC-type dipeptide/oligopeptide/nickel transport system permease component